MSNTTLANIRNQFQFKDLVRRRRKFVGWLTVLTLAPYYGFILVAAFAPNFLATKLSNTSIINVGWPMGLALIIGTWLLTGLYIYRANGEFDDLTAAILARAKS
ncbi:DUF485 domain-containing protein [Variovorax sp. LT1R16]|uniref:DUF485 domain-containing protein n=1 Tax=Variovorax sp. LT1R16 TaxID=3443728 RepID=UPI003F47F4AF